MLLPILSFPDPRLNIVAKPVTEVDKRISTLIADMLETMYEAKGIGLAATQVDVHERLIVIDTSEERNQPLVLINPELTWKSEATHLNEEGCLSVPGIYDGVLRHDAVHVSALDDKGQRQRIEAASSQDAGISSEIDSIITSDTDPGTKHQQLAELEYRHAAAAELCEGHQPQQRP